MVLWPWLLVALAVVCGAQEASICFNACSGHGTCHDYMCDCFPGYHGADCSLSVDQGKEVVPILTAGHFNVSSKRDLLAAQSAMVLVGFSSRACHRCITVEQEYQAAATQIMGRFQVPLARVDVSSTSGHQLAQECHASDIPSLALWHHRRWIKYEGHHTSEAIIEYIRKQRQREDVVVLSSVLKVEAFLRRDPLSVGANQIPDYAVMVVGFFSDPEVEEEDLEEYREAAKHLKVREGIYFGVVEDSAVSGHFKKVVQVIDRTPSLLALAPWMDKPAFVNLDELFGDGLTIEGWIFRSTLPVVGELSGRNFKSYEEIGLPMLILFLDLHSQHHRYSPPPSSSSSRLILGGQTGGVPNRSLLEEFTAVAHEHIGRISFVYADGVALENQMHSLGLYGGKERLPSLAFNLRDGRRLPFSEVLPLNRETIGQFCADFLSGRIHTGSDAEAAATKALKSARPVSTVNTVTRKPPRGSPEQVRGVSESYDGISAVVVNHTNFYEVVMDQAKDVMVAFHADNCEACSHLAPYYRVMAQRFAELAIPSLVIARMDVSHDLPPPELQVPLKALPAIIFFPVDAKAPPYRSFSGLAKSLPLMQWAQQEASIKFTLPDLPHLNEEERERYKKQVYEREMARRRT